MYLKPTVPLFAGFAGAFPLLAPFLLIAGGVACLMFGANVKVPMIPVPMTLQTLALLVIAGSYGPGLAFATVASYLVLGALGLPVFANGGGPAYLVMPTAGFLWGMLLAAPLLAWLLGKSTGPVDTFAMMLLGSLVVLALGAAWLAAFAPAGYDPAWAWQKGIAPFLPGSLVKAALAVALVRALAALPLPSLTRG